MKKLRDNSSMVQGPCVDDCGSHTLVNMTRTPVEDFRKDLVSANPSLKNYQIMKNLQRDTENLRSKRTPKSSLDS